MLDVTTTWSTHVANIPLIPLKTRKFMFYSVSFGGIQPSSRAMTSAPARTSRGFRRQLVRPAGVVH